MIETSAADMLLRMPNALTASAFVAKDRHALMMTGTADVVGESLWLSLMLVVA